MALDLNGTTQLVSIATAIVPLDTGTLSWWAAPDFASSSSGAEIFWHDTQGSRYAVYKLSLANRAQLYFDGRSVDLTVSWTTGILTHFAVRYEKSTNTLELWINGVQCSVAVAASGTWGATSHGVNARLGCDHTGAARFHDGDIAEYAAYNALLSAAEIAQLAGGASPCSVRPANVVGYLPLVADGAPLIGPNAGTLTGAPPSSTHPSVAACLGVGRMVATRGIW